MVRERKESATQKGQEYARGGEEKGGDTGASCLNEFYLEKRRNPKANSEGTEKRKPGAGGKKKKKESGVHGGLAFLRRKNFQAGEKKTLGATGGGKGKRPAGKGSGLAHTKGKKNLGPITPNQGGEKKEL